ncbi:sodium-independent sulfate anion transporter-like isoform X2 [Pseudomyrmex gracilis]|uniref:sodium-independent sulfate anion transporter-like isoform X2 n=1 Tax=Pseudomyrmex gracilis TaxID=219809 RepID=UPI000994B479|nr:sodium-independent sulfate anion transporter-like isoform X2 [Pseudomyrmex gracilis]XP_020300306.1 sodium-independent sulfate anion transporter-like isoform X2 [Pseudomyrmex gracilis]XP_020300307.1 sodium-independent sulfate anion transporter-like isoform X2 [Pseudomyrmex gracilis]XP_020300308.1 sodium-independent sulfate anion transporter-like isoform X2 [Pseudomyrmex gracilis]XP_020300309.1 sodium-independent sulfate anion transporter-like isoform X2 [Pseudomyrmex gracilis]XP_020300310.1 
MAKWCRKDKWRKYVTRRLPFLGWAPRYKPTWLLQDALAGITVGLTAVPQGIAYGTVAGLNPQYGLYAAFMPSFIYVIFGSCENITIGPTAIMATMVQPLVANYGADIAVLIAFLKGCIIAFLGIFHLGFLLDFISLPVITGFTSAAAINIASSQFKSLLGIPGRTESFLDSLKAIFNNLHEIRYEDTLLGVGTIVVLVLLKNIPGRRKGTIVQKIGWLLALSRNALVVIVGTVMAYLFYVNNPDNPFPFKLTGSMDQGLPPFAPPPFSTTFQNRTYEFLELTSAMGTTLFTIPIVSTIEHIAIAKAFAKGKSLDATQEMIALGICNIFGSFVRSMPVTGSFTRTAVNHASGVRTPLGGIFTGGLVLLALGLLTSTFRFIPKAVLAGLIICAMYYMLDFSTYTLLWHARKVDFIVMILTLFPCVFLGLEYGILIGILVNFVALLYFSAKPCIQTKIEQIEGETVIVVIPEEAVAFPAAERLRASIMKLSGESECNVILDCKNLKRIDVTVAKNLKLLAKDLSVRGQTIVCSNCCENIDVILRTVAPELLNVKENGAHHG